MELASTLSNKHLLGIKDLGKNEIFEILNRASYWAKVQSDSKLVQESFNLKPLENKIIVNLFFEPSTRTRFSFEMAAKKLGAHVLNFYPESSSTKKGESFYDTIKTLEAMGADAVIVRHPDAYVLEEICSKVSIPLINAGDGAHEHPSQCLLDLLTIQDHFGHIDGLKVAIIGDILHSRVARSNMLALEKLGAHVLFSGPLSFMPNPNDICANAKIVSMDEAIKEADVVMMLRVQLERHADRYAKLSWNSNSNDFQKSYLDEYGLSLRRFKMMKPHAAIMHPAPFNRNIEIDGSLVESDRSLIYKQVANGVTVRMAILERAICK